MIKAFCDICRNEIPLKGINVISTDGDDITIIPNADFNEVIIKPVLNFESKYKCCDECLTKIKTAIFQLKNEKGETNE